MATRIKKKTNPCQTPKLWMHLSYDWREVISGCADDKGPSKYTKANQFSTLPKPPANKFPLVEFKTLTSYEGEWDQFGISGFGTYTFPHGVKYEGEFQDGIFHGKGALIYPNGQRLVGVFNKGKITANHQYLSKGQNYGTPYLLSQTNDRRFQVDGFEGLQPAGKEFLTADQPTKEIPPNCYDVKTGFYCPNLKSVFSSKTPADVDYKQIKETHKYLHMDNTLMNIVKVSEGRKYEKWIAKECRKGSDENVGYRRREFYKKWVNGRKPEQPSAKDPDLISFYEQCPPLKRNQKNIKRKTL